MDFIQLEHTVDKLHSTAQMLVELSKGNIANFQQLANQIEAKINVRTYSVSEAHKETGIGELKLMNAIKSGEIPYFRDGKAYRITHLDLHDYINSLKNSSK